MNFLVLAMKRSGHHVITEWVKHHTGLPFYNNVCHGWEDKKLLTMIGRKEAKEGIANIEDFNCNEWSNFDFPSFPFLKNCKTIVVIRSMENWLASCYQRKFQSNEERKDVYKYLDKPYINDSKRKSPSRIDLYCKQLEFAYNNPNVICVKFDKFIKDENYRKRLIGIDGVLGCFIWKPEIDKKVIEKMSEYGGGSSFGDLDVLNRKNRFKDDDEFMTLLDKAFGKALKAVKK